MSEEDFFDDFGFTVVDETELNSYQEAQSELQKTSAEADAAQEKIDAAEELSKAHFGNEAIFNREMWDYIVEEYDGKLPIKINRIRIATTANSAIRH